MRVTIQPEATHLLPGSGAKVQPAGPGKRKKMAVASNFRFSVLGLESAGRRVIDVSSILVRRVPVADGDQPDDPAHILQVSDVAFTVPAADVGPFGEWFDDFVIKGTFGGGRERSATLAFLDATLTVELARIDLSGVGIVRCSRSPGTSQVVATVQMYCEKVAFA